MAGKTLDLGSGPNPRTYFDCEPFGIDIAARHSSGGPFGVLPVDLVVSPIPFDDGVFDRVFAHDFLEHVPRLIYLPETFHGAITNRSGIVRRQPFIELMNEVWRVLKPGGVFESCTPMVTDLQTWAGDPTHVNPVSENTFNYLVAQPNVNFEYDLMKRYGFRGCFKLLHKSWRHGSHLYVEMEVVK